MGQHFHDHDNSVHIKFPETIKEVKAPTDESVKLLNEFEDKARKNIIAKVEVADNTLNGIAIAYVDSMMAAMQDGYILHLKFKVNGKEYFVEKKVSQYEITNDNYKLKSDLQNFLHDSLKSAIGVIVLQYLQEEIFKQLQNRK